MPVVVAAEALTGKIFELNAAFGYLGVGHAADDHDPAPIRGADRLEQVLGEHEVPRMVDDEPHLEPVDCCRSV